MEPAASSRPRLPDAAATRPMDIPAVLARGDALDQALRGSELAGLGLTLLDCLAGERLDLAKLPERIGYLVPEAAWRVLGGYGISEVRLPAANDPAELRNTLDGLNALPKLEKLTLAVPLHGDSMELHPLAPRPNLSIELDCHRAGAWRVTAPPGALVRGSDCRADPVHPAEPKVVYCEQDGRPTGVSCAVSGLWHVRQRGPDAAVNWNNKVQFGPGESHRWDIEGPDIVCRHLSLQWLADRAAYRSAAPAAATPPHGFASAESVTGRVSGRSENDYRRICRGDARPVAVGTGEDFGALLQYLVTGLRPGQSRGWLVVTERHAMGLELHLAAAALQTGRDREFVVSLFEPNRTAMELTLVGHQPEQLANFAPRFPDIWFSNGAPSLAAVFACDAEPGASSGATALFGLPEAGMDSPSLLALVMRLGCIQEVRRGVRHWVGSTDLSGDKRLAGLSSCLRTRQGIAVSALAQGLLRGRCDAVAFFMHAVARAGSQVGTVQQRAVLLHAGDAGSTFQHSGLLLRTLDAASPEMPALYARLMLDFVAAMPKLLHELISPSGSWSVSLHTEAAARFNQASPPPAIRQLDACLYAAVHEVLASAAIGERDKSAFLRGLSPRGERLRPSAQAAIACAIVEADIAPALRAGLLRGLLVDLAALPQSLLARPREHALHWLRRILHALPTSGLSARERAKLQSCRPMLTNFVPPHASEPVRRLLRAPGVTVTWTEVAEESSRRHGLRALRVDGNPGWMVCAADTAVEVLEPYRLRPGMRPAVAGEAQAIRYLLAVDRLRPRGTAPVASHEGETAARLSSEGMTPAEPGRAQFGAASVEPVPRPVHEPVRESKSLRAGPAEAVHWKVVDAMALVGAPGLSLRGGDAAFHLRAVKAGLIALSPAPGAPGAMLCAASQPLPELGRYAVKAPKDLKSSQAGAYFYRIPTSELALAPAAANGR